MILRYPLCGEIEPHLPHEFHGGSAECPGWTQEDSDARKLINRVGDIVPDVQRSGLSLPVLELHWAALNSLMRIIDLGPNGSLDRIFGLEVRIKPALPYGHWRLVLAEGEIRRERNERGTSGRAVESQCDKPVS